MDDCVLGCCSGLLSRLERDLGMKSDCLSSSEDSIDNGIPCDAPRDSLIATKPQK